MTDGDIKLNPADAGGAFKNSAGQLAGLAGGSPAEAGLRPGLQASLGQLNGGFQQTLEKGSSAFNTGATASTAMGDTDEASGNKVRGVPDAQDPTKGSGGRGAGGDALRGASAPRLTSADLAKAGSPYQSSMPMNQTAASILPSLTQAAQAIPGALSSPLQGLQGLSGMAAPFQQMLSGAGGNQVLDQMLSKANASNGFDGGPASLALGSASGADGAKLNAIAKNVLGIPYAWGGGSMSGPTQGISDGGGPADRAGDSRKIGFDCSGLSRYVTGQAFGVEIPRTSEAQYAAGVPISASEARPGDLVFPRSAFHGGGGPGHVQVLLDNGSGGAATVLEAPSSGQTVKVSPLSAGAEFRRFHS